MESKQASDISNASSGTSSIKSSHLYDSEIETIVKTNGSKTDINDSSNNFGSLNGGSSDDGGFVSGEEEFEAALERPIVADPDEVTLEKGTEGDELDDPIVGSSDFVISKADTPVAMAAVEDDVEEDPKVGKLGGEKIEEDGIVLGEESGVVGGLVTSPAVENGVTDEISVDSIDSNSIGVEAAGIFVEASGEKLNSNELVGRDGDKGTENSELDDVENVAVVESTVPVEAGLEAVEGVQSEDLNTKNFVALAAANDGAEGVKEIAYSSGDGNQVEAKIIEPAESEFVESDGVKFTTEGDSILEEIHVNLLERGVAVVGEAEENKDSDTNEVKVPVNGSANTSFEPLTNHDAETSESELVGLKTDVPVEINQDDDDGGSESLDVVKKEKTLEAEIKTEFDFEAGKNDSIAKGAEADEDGVHAADSVSESMLADTVHEVKHLGGDINGVSSAPHPPKYAAQDGSLDTGAIVTDDAEVSESVDMEKEVKTQEAEVKPLPDSKAKENDSTVKLAVNGVEFEPGTDPVGADEDGVKAVDSVDESIPADVIQEAKHLEGDRDYVTSLGDGLEDGFPGEFHPPKHDEPRSIFNTQGLLESEDEVKDHTDDDGDMEGSLSDGETDGLIFGSSEAAKQFIEELERESGPGSQLDGESYRDHSQRIDGQIVTDSDEEVDDADEGGGKELFDSAALAALLKAATGADPDSGGITISSQDGSRLFSVERPAGLGSSLRALRPTPRSNRPNIFSPSLTTGGESENNLSGEEKMKLEKLQSIRVKFLRIVHRLGLSTEESIAAQVLYRLALVAGRQTSQLFSLDAAKRIAMELEEDDGKDEDLDFSVNILVLGKSGVGKSATINSIFNENKASIDAFEHTTNSVKEISGMVDGVKIKVFDTPGLKASVMEQAFNRKVLSSIQKFTKKSPPDIVLYVDRLDAQTRDLNDLPLLKTITGSLGQPIWRSAIVTLTHGASAPPDGPSGSPLSYEVFVAQRSHVVQHSIGQAVGDLRMMSPSLMNPVSLVENHPSCRKNRDGQKILPNGQSWRPQLLLLCYSMKILAEASSLSKPQDPFDHRRLFGRVRAPPLPYLLSSMLQTRAHPKLSSDQGGDNGGDSDIDLADLSDSDQEDEEDEYDQLPPFKPLRKSQIAKLTKEQRKAYFEEYDYRVKLLRKQQWREELKRLKEIKKRGNDAGNEYGYIGEDADQENSPAPVAVPLPDMALPPSFDGDTPAYRYRFLEPSSQFLARPVLDTHGWDHDCGYDGVSLENSLAIAGQFPAAVAVQITKDKKEFSIHLDSSVSAKHGENGSSMAGFDIQTIGKQLAYVIRGETKFKNLKNNKTATGVTITFLGENVATGFKIEDQIALGKQWGLSGSGGIVRSNGDSAYGANFELQRRELDYPIGPVQSTCSLSLIKWRGDWALGLNTLAQFSIGRSSKVAVRAGINNKLSGQITVRTSSSDSLSLALAGIIPIAINVYKKIWPSVGESYSIY